MGIADAVVFRVFSGIANGRLDDFYAVYVPGLFCQEEGDRPRAAVDVDNRFFAGQIRIGQGCFVEFLCLFTVDLEEGLSRYAEIQVTDGVGNGRASVYDLRLITQDDVRMARIDVLHDARKARHFFAQHVYEVLHMRYDGHGRDDTDHDFSRMDTRSSHNMADNARSPVFIIGGNLIVLHPLPHDGNDLIISVFLYGTGIDINNAMRLFGKTADVNGLLFATYGKLHFISIVPRPLGTQGRQDGNILQLTDMLYGILHLPLFFRQLPFIRKVLQLTAAAIGIDRTRRLYAMR